MRSQFEVSLPIQVVEQHWKAFAAERGANDVEIEYGAAGGDTTRVTLVRDGGDAAALDELAMHFKRYAQAKGEGHIPLVGTMVSPGAPNAGMNDTAGLDTFPEGGKAPRT